MLGISCTVMSTILARESYDTLRTILGALLSFGTIFVNWSLNHHRLQLVRKQGLSNFDEIIGLVSKRNSVFID